MPVSALYAADGQQFCGSDSGGCSAANDPQYSGPLLHCWLGPPGQMFAGTILSGAGNLAPGKGNGLEFPALLALVDPGGQLSGSGTGGLASASASQY